MAIDEGKLHEFVGKAVGDMGAAMSAALVVIGDKLGLYRAMAGVARGFGGRQRGGAGRGLASATPRCTLRSSAGALP